MEEQDGVGNFMDVETVGVEGAIDDAIRTCGKNMSKKQKREEAKKVAKRLWRLRMDLRDQPIREEGGAKQK